MRLIFHLTELDSGARLTLSRLSLVCDEPFSIAKKPYSLSRLWSDKMLLFHILEIEPVYPNFAPFGLLLGLAVFFFGFPAWLYIPAGVIVLSGWLHSKTAYLLGLWLGLKKNRSRSRIVVLSEWEVVRFLVWKDRTFLKRGRDL